MNPTHPTLDFSHLIGQQIPGGCDDCDAYQTARPLGAAQRGRAAARAVP